jgi:hypothetical protein
MIAAAVLALVFAASSWIAYRATRPVEQALRPFVRLDVDLGPDVSLGSPNGADEIISPDGTRLVYVSQGRLFTRRLDQPNATELAGTQGAYEPFFSPDGQWVAFFTTSNLKKISVEGGSAISLCDASAVRAAVGARMATSSRRSTAQVACYGFLFPCTRCTTGSTRKSVNGRVRPGYSRNCRLDCPPNTLPPPAIILSLEESGSLSAALLQVRPDQNRFRAAKPLLLRTPVLFEIL